MSLKENETPKAVGASDMEDEHELLVSILHELQDALAGGLRDSVAELLGRFEDVANLHFMEEQSLMRLHAYPGYAAHELEHDDLLAELRVLSQQITAGDFDGVDQAAKRLEDWLMTHMKTTDHALEEYLEQEGIRAGGPA